MTANTTTPTTTAKAPCGCSGGGTAPSSCGCGGKCGGSGQCGCNCGPCQAQVFARPQFFAGQLLTEDDLQSLVDYVVAKNRLHNRNLFGDGVVCGLTVTCPPCESGHVLVNPGYALDCCGNDIVLPCSKDLDINHMVRELLRGTPAGCGDPCPDTTATNANTTRQPVKARRYDLYIKYCEQPADPVAPYAANTAACGQGACEPTRIRECYTFELRCPTEHACESGVTDRFRSCIGNDKIAERMVTDQEFLRGYLGSLEEGVRKIRQQPETPLNEAFWAQTKEHTTALAELFEHPDSHATLIAVGKLHAALEQVLDLTADMARVLVRPPSKALRKQDLELLERAESMLKRASEPASVELLEKAFPAHLPRAQVFSLLHMTRELIADSRQLREAAAEGNVFESGFRGSFAARLLMERVVFDLRMARAVAESLDSLRDWLIARLEQPGGTHCALMCQVNAVGLTTPGTTEANESLANTLVTGGTTLIQAMQEIIRSCACEALIPPCAPCEDTAVLLACITVEDCKVIDICNLARKFVLTWPNIRYWFPEVCRTGKALEKWCCPSCEREYQPPPTRQTFVPRTEEESLYAAFGKAPGFAGLALSTLIEPPLSREVAADTTRAPLARNVSRWLTEEGHLRETILSGGATEKLRGQLEDTLAELTTLKRDQAKLRERLAKLEAKKAPGDRQ